jgi:lipoprotein-anchoring transpeptidase ErfK/SrfK
MLRRTILLTAIIAVLPLSAALAAISGSGEDIPARTQTQTRTQAQTWTKAVDGVLRLAQSGGLEVYFDGQGRRVIIDSRTGEVVAIQPARPQADRQAERRAERLRQLDRRDSDRYYLDDPEDMARLRRDMARERGYYPREDDYSIDEFPQAPGAFPGEPPIRAYPSDPRYVEPIPGEGQYEARRYEEPEVISREPIERAPLAPPTADGNQDDTIYAPSGPSGPPIVNYSGLDDVARLQVLLDRAGASPGVIDGKFGSNVDKALAAYGELTGRYLRSTDTAEIKKEIEATGGAVFTTYTITPEDAAGPYVASVPADYGEKAKLERLSYTSVSEGLAERFHMDEAYLKSLNPDANFNRPGTIIKVVNIGGNVATPVARIVADKHRKQVRAYGLDGKLVAAYPATIGSSDTPSPSGTHAVSRVAFNPNYTYNPKINFKQGDNDKVLTIPPGPNGPVGSVWIALDKPTYGIHGTPDPSKIGKTASHGCVRLTNWDAQELARIVKPGVMVEFVD